MRPTTAEAARACLDTGIDFSPEGLSDSQVMVLVFSLYGELVACKDIIKVELASKSDSEPASVPACDDEAIAAAILGDLTSLDDEDARVVAREAERREQCEADRLLALRLSQE